MAMHAAAKLRVWKIAENSAVGVDGVKGSLVREILFVGKSFSNQEKSSSMAALSSGFAGPK